MAFLSTSATYSFNVSRRGAFFCIDQSSKWLLCGLELDDFPRPQLETLATLTHEEQSASAGQMKFEGISTRNVSAELGLDFRYASRAPPAGMLIYQSFGGGVACLDFDQDGWCDFYFAQADGTPEERTEKSGNVLMKSLRGANFYDVSTHAQVNDRGYGQTVNVSDINQDGFPDLLVGNFGSNVLLLNSGDGTFRDASEPAGFNMYRTVTTGLCAADLDHDGLPEVIEINYTDDPLVLTKRCRDYKGFERACSPTHFKPGFDHVWKNLGDGRFDRFMPIELNRETARYGLGVIVANLDGLPGNEIFVANDMTPNELWVGDIVDGTVSYKDVATYKGCALGVQNTPSACMGVALGDFDGNGAQDLFVTNLYHESNDLFMQQRAGVFTNQATKTGIHDYSFNSLGFGTQAIDIDNNGDLDLVVLNGHVDDYTHRNIPFRMLPQLLLGDRRRFSLVPPDVAGDFFARPTLGRALARCDFNRDGAVDWIATHLDETVAMVKNESKIQNWIQLELVGTRSERDAIGTTVIADLGNKGKSQFAVATGDGYMARNEQIVSIGVGMTHSVNSLTIIWPEGEQQSFENIAVNKRYLIIEQRNGLFERK